MQIQCKLRLTQLQMEYLKATILDKTVEKMSHSQTIFPNILAVPRPPFPLPLEAMLLCVLKQP